MNVLPSGDEALDRVQNEVKRDLDDLLARPLVGGLLQLSPTRLSRTADLQPGQTLAVYVGVGGHTLTLPKTTDADSRGQVLLVCHSGTATGGLLRVMARSPERMGREIYRWMGPGDVLAFVSDGGQGKWFVLDTGQQARGRMRLYEEFFEATALSGLVGVTNGGAGTNTAITSGIDRPGLGDPQTGGTATGAAGYQSSLVALDTYDGAWLVGMDVVFGDSLSSVAERYIARCGLQDVLGGDSTDGVYFRYTDNVNGGRWEAVCRNSGAETAADTGYAATSYPVFQKLEIVIAPAAKLAQFFINGVQRAQITTNLPANGRVTGWMPSSIQKTVGTTTRRCYIDWAELIYWLDRVR